MGVEKNIQEVSLALGINIGKNNMSDSIKPLSVEWFAEKAKEFKEDETRAEVLYTEFDSNYGIKKLSSIHDNDILNELFLGTGCENMCHTLEYISINNELFGSIKGGNAFKYPLHFDSNSKSWVTGTSKNPIIVSMNDAIKIAEDVKKFIIDSVRVVSNSKPLDTVNKYIELYAELYGLNSKYVDNLWFAKYLHMIFPEDFPTFYNEKWQKLVLNIIDEEPSDSSFGRMGQIMQFIRKCGISTVTFNRVFEKYAKNYKYKKEEYEGYNDEDLDIFEESKRLSSGENVILYGVPGAGKSWTIDNEYSDKNTIKERVVFHPDYTYSDFVGQILPQSKNGDVTYDFVPGPFTKIMKEAYYNPTIKYILVIEEINRGNAPAIFGDIFQLLDRYQSADTISQQKKGESVYGIINSDVAKIIYDNPDHEVKIPSNLSIICTMNTSDQNVFTLDTAFQRRWNMRLIENVFKEDTDEDKRFTEINILDTGVTWKHFCNTINDLILDKNQNMTSSEDKRLGVHFVHVEDLTFDNNEDSNDNSEKIKAKLQNRRFPEKVIKYLWDDAFKFYRDEIFKGEFNSLEKVIREFTSKKNEERFNIFKDNIKAEIISKPEQR